MIGTKAVAALLAALAEKGIAVETDGKRLRWRPNDAVPPALVVTILSQRAGIIQLLTERKDPSVKLLAQLSEDERDLFLERDQVSL